MSRELKVLREFYVEVCRLREIDPNWDNALTTRNIDGLIKRVDDYYNPTKQQLDLWLIEDMTD